MMTGFEQQPARPQDPVASPHFHHWQACNGEIVSFFYRTHDGFMLRFRNRADFTITLEDRRVSCTPSLDVSQSIISALYFNQVVPLLASYDGDLVLHASAAVSHYGALAFLGASGRGKSTLAAGFARAGYPFLTDDGLWLEQVCEGYLAKPNRPGVRLWADSETAVLGRCTTQVPGDCFEKRYLAVGPTLPFQNRACSLHLIYVLGEGLSDRTTIKQLAPSEAIPQLIRHAFLLDFDDRPRHRAHFERLVQLAETVDCFTLDYPRQYVALPEVITAVLKHAAVKEDDR